MRKRGGGAIVVGERPTLTDGVIARAERRATPLKAAGQDRGYLSVQEVAVLLGIGKSMAYDLISRNEFPFPVIRLGTYIRVQRAAVEKAVGAERVAAFIERGLS
jgi:excisionase family DNA binding protein